LAALPVLADLAAGLAAWAEGHGSRNATASNAIAERRGVTNVQAVSA
jgi:hypothetical protein